MFKSCKYIGLFILFVFVFGFDCPFFKFFGISCPACGVTRAWSCFLSGDLVAAINYNPMFLPLTVLFVRIIFADINKQSLNRFELVIYCFIAVFAFLFNIFRVVL